MPRRPRQHSSSGYPHFINRGVNKKRILHRMGNFEFYKGLLKGYGDKFFMRILHDCLVSNHTH